MINDVKLHWSNRPGLYYAGLCLLALLFIVFAINWTDLLDWWGGNTAPHESLRNLALIVAGAIGIGLAAWRRKVAAKQAEIAYQGQITDRINEAVKGLGSEKTIKEISETPRYQREGENWKRDKDGRLIPALRPDGAALIDREVLM